MAEWHKTDNQHRGCGRNLAPGGHGDGVISDNYFCAAGKNS
jgi:hypothetical protein